MVHRSDVRGAILGLAALASEITPETLTADGLNALKRTLLDSFGVAIAGIRTSELANLLSVWPTPHGESSVWGTKIKTDPHSATLLVGTALCSLELDEGNKMARGHPGAHVIPAVISEAERLRVSGPELFSALLAGYEVATRIATAFHPRPGLHPHGHWGAIGAAVGVGKLYGFSPAQLAQAIDAAAALPIASPFSTALDGAFVRNLFVGVAGCNGITTARLVAAGLGSVASTLSSTFDDLIGELQLDTMILDASHLTITQGYFKRHSACAYTHAAADAAVQVREAMKGRRINEIESVTVQTYGLASPLNDPQPTTRLGAMFSIPHVVAVALTTGHVRPKSFDLASIEDSELSRLRLITKVETDREIDARLPAKRGARVSVKLASGRIYVAEVPNAIGDADHFPLSTNDIKRKLSSIIGESDCQTISDLVDSLPNTHDVSPLLGMLTMAENPI